MTSVVGEKFITLWNDPRRLQRPYVVLHTRVVNDGTVDCLVSLWYGVIYAIVYMDEHLGIIVICEHGLHIFGQNLGGDLVYDFGPGMFQTYFIQQKYEIITIAEYEFLSHEKFYLEVLFLFYGPIADFAVEPIDLNEERSSFFE